MRKEARINTFVKTCDAYQEICLNDIDRANRITKENLKYVISKYGDPKHKIAQGLKEFDKEMPVWQNAKMLEDSQKFKLDYELTNIFLNTDSDVEYIHTPFDKIFIDTIIPITKNTKIYGLLVFNSPEDKTLGVLCHAIDESDGLIRRHFTSFGFSYWKNEIIPDHIDIPCDIDKPLVKKKIALFVISFLKFLYNPEVELIKKEYSWARIRKGQRDGKEVTDHHYLKITGKTREYISNFSKQVGERYEKHTDSWIVRGYYMKLSHKRYKENIGKEIWVAPYVKGFGKIKSKEYIVTEKKKIFYHQTIMENIVTSIFKNHLVLKNTRGFLNGLEIDCYIPDLKIGFEYNGEQHYNFISAFHKDENDLIKQKKRDILKNKLALERGIKLITIRYDEELSEELIQNKLKDKQPKESQVMEELVKVNLL